MDEPSVSSLEWFLRAHGADFTAQHAPESQPAQSGQWAAALSILAAAAFVIVFRIAMATLSGASLAPMLVAIVFAAILAAVVAIYRRQKRNRSRTVNPAEHKTPTGVPVSLEAQALVSALMLRHVWSTVPLSAEAGSVQWAPRLHPRGMDTRRAESDRLLGSIPAADVPLLEEAVFEYNRTAGLVDSAGASESLKRLGPSVMRGADEAMAGFFHQLELAAEFPESAKPSRGTLSSSVSKLRELADRVEALRMQQAQPVGDTNALSNLEGVLEELRLEQLAVSELAQTQDEPLQDHLQA